MAEIKQYPKDRIVMLELSDDELDRLLEIALQEEATLNEIIICAFEIGITTWQRKLYNQSMRM